MVDNLSPNQRTECMRRVTAANTSPEIRVRKLIHSMGYRYALHVKRLPGKPDIVLVSRGKVIFVHGCFWHSHRCRRGNRLPSTNVGYWSEKRQRNATRDRQHIHRLRAQGWQVFVVWECWTQSEEGLREKLKAFLELPPKHTERCRY